jgi:anti-sigma B factor antagonist
LSDLSVTPSIGNTGPTVLHVRGELDFDSVGVLRAPGLAAAANDRNGLILDLGEVTHLDSSGLGVLIEIYDAARNHGVAIGLLNIPTPVRRWIKITGLTDFFGLPQPSPADR